MLVAYKVVEFNCQRAWALKLNKREMWLDIGGSVSEKTHVSRKEVIQPQVPHGYLVTTSPQSPVTPWGLPPLRVSKPLLEHLTPMV